MISNNNPFLGPVCKSFRKACPIIGNDGTFSACSTESFQSPAPFFRNITYLKIKVVNDRIIENYGSGFILEKFKSKQIQKNRIDEEII